MTDPIAIAGAGIGGLTTALALHEAGREVEVIEAVKAIEPLGVGINLQPHAVRELAELGLLDALASTGVETSTRLLLDRHGSEIWREPLGRGAGYRWPQISIHRGHLQFLLLEAVGRRMGKDTVMTGMALRSFAHDDTGVVLRVDDRNEGSEVERDAVALIGADGIHSVVRAQMYPQEGLPRWGGIHMWRGVTRMMPFLDGRSWFIAGSNTDTKLVVYPITPPDEKDESLINWVVEVRRGIGSEARLGDWTSLGERADVLDATTGITLPFLDVEALVGGAEQVLEYPMVDRDPLPRWTQDRVTLIGDAAHPMYPIGANGATQAILDARHLAWHVARSHTLEEAFAAYEEQRLPVANEIVLTNRSGGPESPLSIVAARAPDGFDRIEDVMSPEELAEIADRYRRLTGSDVEHLNRRPSLSVG